MFEVAPFGQYTLLSRLAVGGMAELFVAHDNGDYGPRLVVIKRVLPELSTDSDFIKMFIDEARIVSTLQHEAVLGLLDFGSVDESYFIAMEYVEGTDVAALDEAARDAGEPLTPEEAAWILERSFRGLDYAHNRTDTRGRPLQIVHRDVSPENLLVGVDGRLVVADFGIAKAAQRLSVTRVGMIKGKAGYMSPELFSAEKIDLRHDIFSGGIVLWQMLTGKPMFAELTEQGILAKLKGGPLTPPSHFNKAVAPGLDAIVSKAIALEREQRFQSALAAADALAEWLQGRGFTDGPQRLAKKVRKLFGADLDRRRLKLRGIMDERALGLPAAGNVDRTVVANLADIPPPPESQPAKTAKARPRLSSTVRSLMLGALGALLGTSVLVMWWLLR